MGLLTRYKSWNCDISQRFPDANTTSLVWLRLVTYTLATSDFPTSCSLLNSVLISVCFWEGVMQFRHTLPSFQGFPCLSFGIQPAVKYFLCFQDVLPFCCFPSSLNTQTVGFNSTLQFACSCGFGFYNFLCLMIPIFFSRALQSYAVFIYNHFHSSVSFIKIINNSKTLQKRACSF